MTIKTQFEGKEITAAGTHYPFEDAYADLQNKLGSSTLISADWIEVR